MLPSLEIEQEDEETTDLTYQLLQFKKFKEVALFLKELQAKGHYSFIREGSTEQFTTFYPDPAVNVSVLQSAMQGLARSLEEITKLPKDIVKEVVSISDKIKELQKNIAEKFEMKLSDMIQSNSKTEIVVTFLAMLELIKQQILTVEQESLFSDIKIKKV